MTCIFRCDTQTQTHISLRFKLSSSNQFSVHCFCVVGVIVHVHLMCFVFFLVFLLLQSFFLWFKVKMLRDRKANMWLRNAKGDLPLHEAASSGRRELVLWLLDQKPKHVNTTSNDGRTILHIAASNDYADMCKVHTYR